MIIDTKLPDELCDATSGWPRDRCKELFFRPQSRAIDRSASTFPDNFTLGNAACARSRPSSVFALARAAKSEFLANHVRTFFALAERNAILFVFNHFHGHYKSTRSSPLASNKPTKVSPGRASCGPFAMSLFRHIVPSSRSAEKPYPAPYHLMAKRYRTHPRSVGVYSGFRVGLPCPGLKWSPGFRVCSCKP